jgi:hypothetical protein
LHLNNVGKKNKAGACSHFQLVLAKSNLHVSLLQPQGRRFRRAHQPAAGHISMLVTIVATSRAVCPVGGYSPSPAAAAHSLWPTAAPPYRRGRRIGDSMAETPDQRVPCANRRFTHSGIRCITVAVGVIPPASPHHMASPQCPQHVASPQCRHHMASPQCPQYPYHEPKQPALHESVAAMPACCPSGCLSVHHLSVAADSWCTHLHLSVCPPFVCRSQQLVHAPAFVCLSTICLSVHHLSVAPAVREGRRQLPQSCDPIRLRLPAPPAAPPPTQPLSQSPPSVAPPTSACGAMGHKQTSTDGQRLPWPAGRRACLSIFFSSGARGQPCSGHQLGASMCSRLIRLSISPLCPGVRCPPFNQASCRGLHLFLKLSCVRTCHHLWSARAAADGCTATMAINCSRTKLHMALPRGGSGSRSPASRTLCSGQSLRQPPRGRSRKCFESSTTHTRLLFQGQHCETTAPHGTKNVWPAGLRRSAFASTHHLGMKSNTRHSEARRSTRKRQWVPSQLRRPRLM